MTMKRVFFILLLFVLGACESESTVSTLPNPVPDQQLSSVNKGISLILSKDVYTDSQPIMNVLIQNDSLTEYSYGPFYHIEIKKEGLWYMMTHSDSVFFSNPSFRDLGGVLPIETEVQETFYVEILDVQLSPGEYRLVKTFASRNEPYYEVSIAAPFTIQ